MQVGSNGRPRDRAAARQHQCQDAWGWVNLDICKWIKWVGSGDGTNRHSDFLAFLQMLVSKKNNIIWPKPGNADLVWI